jgi:hypothetical protein
MAIENVLDSEAFTAHNRVNVIDNDCDTAISAVQGGQINGNTVDLSQAPPGRGIQPGFPYAIECGRDTLIANNTVKYHANGVLSGKPGVSVVGNKFYNLGRDGTAGGAAVNLDPFPHVDTDMNYLIEGNHFYNTGRAGNLMSDIEITPWNDTYKARGVSIIGNYSYDCSGSSMQLSLLDGKVSDNFIFNAWKYGVANPNAIYSTKANNTIEFTNNTIINTVTGAYHLDHGIKCQTGDIVGFNKFVGLTGTAIEGTPTILQAQMVNGVPYDPQPTYENNTAATTGGGGLPVGARYRTSTGVQMVVY